ncbi:MAG TPA: D-aminoacyl-tRNA deacylase [Flavitalea sp.]|nr:D-aminoacyl-tRNA deacylase [Flavitalea sp.]
MKALIQRVSQGQVSINGQVRSSIGGGLVVLLGITQDDGTEDIEWLARKIVNLRIFNDEAGLMNRSLLETGGDILLISQFTLHASVKKGNRPSFIKAARPEAAVPLYEQAIARLEAELGKKIGVGEFGADMQVSLTNDGPVTIMIDTKEKE